MSEWQTDVLENLVSTPITYGVVKPGDFLENGIKLIRGGDVYKGKISQTLRTITPELSKQYQRTILEGGELIVSLVGNPGEVALVPKVLAGANLARQVGLVRLKNNIYSNFVLYYLMSPQGVGQLSSKVMGSVQQVINLADLRKVEIQIPPIEEQKAISSVLSSLDDKIDLLHRQNTTLEGMAETLFRQWFVEEAQEDWEEYKVSDFAEHLKQGVNPAQNPLIEYHHYSLPAFDENQCPVFELGAGILSNKYRVLENTILVSKLNPRFPRIWAIQNLPSTNSVCSTEFQVFKPKQDNLYAYLYFLFGSSQARDELEMAASGTSGSHQRVRPEDMLNITTQLPSISKAKEFSEITQPYIDKISANRKQIQTLEKLRDNLLPKLMMGEARVEF